MKQVEEEEEKKRSSSASMLRAGRMEEFVTEDEEPWYDQRDLEQGEVLCRVRVCVCERGVIIADHSCNMRRHVFA